MRDPSVAEATVTDAFTLGSIRRRLLTGSAWVLGARVAGLGLSLAMNGLLARLLGPNRFGVFLLTGTMVVIGSTLAGMGLNRSVVRFAAASLAVGEPGGARDAIRIAVGWTALAAAAIGLVLSLGSGQWFFRHVLDQPGVAAVVPLAAGWLFASSLQIVLTEAFRGLSRFAYAALLQTFVTDFVTVGVLGGVYLYAQAATLSQALGIVTGVATLVMLLTGALLIKTMSSLRGPGDVRRQEMFRVARPLLVTSLGIYLLGHGIDLWILGAFRPTETVSLYGSAAKLVVLVATPMVIFSGVIPPLVAELHAQGKVRKLERTLRTGATIIGIPALLVLLVFIVAGPWVLDVIYGPFYRQAAPILVVLSSARAIAIWTGTCGIALMMTGHQRDMMWTTIVSACVSIAGGLLAAPRFGAMGVAVATGVGQLLQNGWQLLLARRRLGIWTHVTFSRETIRELVRRGGPRGG